MPFLELNLDHFASLSNDAHVPGIDPVIVAGIAEIAGVDGLSITSLEGETAVVRRIIETVSIRMNWRIPINDKSIGSLLSNPPDLVTFIDPLKTSACINLRSEPDLERVFNQIRSVKSLAVAVRIESDLRQAKLAYKLGADFIEIDTRPYTHAQSRQAQLEALEIISGVTRIAEKYNMGVIATGGLNYQNFRNLVDLGTIQTISIGRAILGKAIYLGLENALRDFIFLLK